MTKFISLFEDFVMRYTQLLAVGILSSVSSLGYSQYFDYDPDNPAEQAPIRKGEKSVIPLDTEDPTYNLWQTPKKLEARLNFFIKFKSRNNSPIGLLSAIFRHESLPVADHL